MITRGQAMLRDEEVYRHVVEDLLYKISDLTSTAEAKEHWMVQGSTGMFLPIPDSVNGEMIGVLKWIWLVEGNPLPDKDQALRSICKHRGCVRPSHTRVVSKPNSGNKPRKDIIQAFADHLERITK